MLFVLVVNWTQRHMFLVKYRVFGEAILGKQYMWCVILLQESVTSWWRKLAALYNASDADLENGVGRNNEVWNVDFGGKKFCFFFNRSSWQVAISYSGERQTTDTERHRWRKEENELSRFYADFWWIVSNVQE